MVRRRPASDPVLARPSPCCPVLVALGKRQGCSRVGQGDGDAGHDLNHDTHRLRDLARGRVGGGDLHGVAARRREVRAAQIQLERGTLGGRGGSHSGQELVRRRG